MKIQYLAHKMSSPKKKPLLSIGKRKEALREPLLGPRKCTVLEDDLKDAGYCALPSDVLDYVINIVYGSDSPIEAFPSRSTHSPRKRGKVPPLQQSPSSFDASSSSSNEEADGNPNCTIEDSIEELESRREEEEEGDANVTHSP